MGKVLSGRAKLHVDRSCYKVAKGKNIDGFLLDNVALPECPQVLKKRICSSKSKFFPLRVDSP